jgi:hypothetical protein
MIRNCIVLFCLIIFISCGNKNKIPPGILKPDKMQAVLWDVIKADAFTTEFIKKDSAKDAVRENLKLQQEIFTIHHISKQDFYKSYDYLKLNPDLFRILMDSLIAKEERDKQKNLKARPRQVE